MKNTSSNAFCESKQSKKQYVFTLAVYNGIAPGTPISEIEKIVKSQSDAGEFVKEHFIEALLTLYYANNITDPRGPEFESDQDSENVSDIELRQNSTLYTLFTNQFRTSLPHLFWVSDNMFAVCENGNCFNMQYPTNKSLNITIDAQGWGDGRCNDFFLNEGYVSGLGCYGNKNGLLSFMKATGFNGGWLAATQYYNLPLSEKNNVCRRLGLQTGCLDDPQNSLYGGSPADKVLRDSATAIPLIIKDGTKISTKVLKNWTVHRITWDPSLMCKYGRSKNDFSTH